MRPILTLALTFCACRPAGPPEGTLEPVAEGIAVAQAPAPATHGAARSATDACAEPGLEVFDEAPPHYLALPTLWASGVDDPYRQAQVVRVGSGACQVVAVFPIDEQPPHTGGGGSLYDNPDLSYAMGFLFDLVEAGDELWLFGNTSFGFWRIDPASGAIEHDDGIPGMPVGATSDGAGGAWVTTTLLMDSDGDTSTPARLWHLDGSGTVQGDPIDLPFDPHTLGLSWDDGEGHSASRFIFHPVAITPSGDVWVLDSTTGTLFEAGSGRTLSLGLTLPTGLVSAAGGLLVTAGADVDFDPVDGSGEPAPVMVQMPGLHYVDLASEEVVLVTPIPDPSVPWWAGGGFTGPTPTSEASVLYNVWFPMSVVDDSVVMADPTFGRVFVFDPAE